MLTSPPRAFSQYATAHECEDLPVDVSGQPGERVRLLFSYDSGFEYRPELASVRGLGEPLVAFAHRVSDGGVTAFVPLLLESGAMGEIDGNGGLSTQIPFRRLPPGQDAQVFFIQAALREPGVGVVALTPPATVVLLRDPFCGIERLYVDGDASPGGTGEDWSSAISDLHVALALAETDGFEEIWVKEGVYRPDVPGGSRAASFVVPAGVRLYGGFRGDETRLEQRVIDQERTTLSGDLDGDDLPGLAFENNDENSIHVVTLALPGGQLVDGLTIEGGNASIGLDIDSRGGGVVANGVSSWKLANCTLVRNEAVTEGGGLYANGGSYVVASCSFLGSQAVFGGGMYSRADGVQDAVLVNCAFSGCRADSGGGLYASGGAMGSGTGSITSCSFSANGAEFFGGGARFVNLSVSYPFAVSNSIFWRNFDVGGVDESSQLSIDSHPALVGVSFSCIEGLDELAGNDNIGLDPLFVAPLGLDALTGTLDDDLGLDPTSPCIDSGLNVDLLPDVADLDADANDQEPTPRDRARRARRRDIASVPDMSPDTAPIVDRGAYELGDD
jgi:hypothetical protein